MQIIQIIGILFALFAYSRTSLRFKDKRITAKEFLFWTIVWVGVIIVAIIPGVMSGLSRFLGIGRPIDIIVYASIIILFYLIFRIYVKIEDVEQNITKIVRETAIRRKKK